MSNIYLVNKAKAMMAAIVVAVAMAMACSSMAFADTFRVYVDADGVVLDETVELGYVENSPAVYGQFYKSNTWNVLATTDYVSLDSAIQSALDVYNQAGGTNVTAKELITGHSVKFITSDYPTVDSPYSKYAATYADVYETVGFFGGVNNSITAFNQSLLTYTNPTGAVLAKSYGTAKTSTTAAAAGEAAKNSQTESPSPRLITGCSSDMTSSTAMGKRYVYDVLGVVIK